MAKKKKQKQRAARSAPTVHPGRDPLPLMVALLAFLASAVLLVLLRRFYHDDAYIVLRYAQNLMEGHGPVWNPGERIEGYTSLLWVLASGALGALGLDLETASRLLGLLSFAGLLVVLIRTEGKAGLPAACMLAVTGPLVAWSLGGLETLGFTFLLTTAMLGAARIVDDPSPAPGAVVGVGVLFALAELCRPEAALFVVTAVVSLIATGGRSRNPKLSLLFFAGFAPIYLTRLFWRLTYYGDWLPNPYYVKVPAGWTDVTTGLGYLFGFLIFFPGLVLLGAVAVRRKLGNPVSAGEGMLGLSILLYLAYVTWIGGDHMQWYRFIVPVLPVAVLLASRRLVTPGQARVERGAWMLVAGVCALNLVSTLLLMSAPISPALDQVMKGWKYRDPAASLGRLVGLHIRDRWPEDAVVALNTAGSTAYFSERRCIDMLGLNDGHISRRQMPGDLPDLYWAKLPGHRKGDGAYVLSRQPDFIIFGGAEGSVRPWFVSDLEIVQDPTFPERYRLKQVPISAGPGRRPFPFLYFERRD